MSGSGRVFAIWMESAELEWINSLVAAGKLPHFKKLRAEGTYSDLEGPEHTVSEIAHPMLYSGCTPSNSGAWSVQPFDPTTYQLLPTEAFQYESHPPFYDLDSSIRTLTFDLSEMPIFDHLPATQIAGWGAHAPLGPRCSKPSGLVEEIVSRFGDHPTGLGRDQADAHSPESLQNLFRDVMRGLKMREQATIALVAEQPWDLFLTGFSELHSAGHFLMPPANQEDSLAQWCQERLGELYSEIDATLGRILNSLPESVRVVVYSIHGMRANYEDSMNLLLLPELLFRHNFQTKGLDFDHPRPARESMLDWGTSVWKMYSQRHWLRHNFKRKAPEWLSLRVEKILGMDPEPFPPRSRVVMNSHPTAWYRPYWPEMNAFVLPTHSDGYIRLNVRGREGEGLIDPSNYSACCDEIEQLLRDLTLPESSEPAVANVIRTRSKAFCDDRLLPQGDLIVQWNPASCGHFESPEYGNFGPVPFYRTGAHTNHGFLLAKGPGISAGEEVAQGAPVDVSATILELLGVPKPSHMDGHSLVSPNSLPETRVA